MYNCIAEPWKLWATLFFFRSLTPLIFWHIPVQARIADLCVFQAPGFFSLQYADSYIRLQSALLPVATDGKCTERKVRPCTHMIHTEALLDTWPCYASIESPRIWLHDWLLNAQGHQSEENFRLDNQVDKQGVTMFSLISVSVTQTFSFCLGVYSQQGFTKR